MRRLVTALCFGLLLGSCAPAEPEAARRGSAAPDSPLSEPPLAARFGAPRPAPPRASNTEIARDLLDLVFLLESGKGLSTFTRFDGPITLRVAGTAPPSLDADLSRLLRRLREEAGIDISRTRAKAANITLLPVPRETIRAELPQAACFVVPGVSSLAEYRRARRAGSTSWVDVRKRETAAVFLPADAAPQELRDCLHEEIAQALGPLNDLYRLGDSVFNDDNVHAVLTGYDMLVLRVLYDPELRTGMSRAEMAQRLPAVLARLNPRGEGLPDRHLTATPPAWVAAIRTALSAEAAMPQRRASAADALRLARAEGWRDHRLGFVHFVRGRLLQGDEPAAAKAEFDAARRIFSALPDARLHEAYVDAQLAALALRAGDAARTLDLVTPQQETATRYENAALLATLTMLRAEALALSGRSAEAARLRLDSLGWARYGFGPDWAAAAKLREIAALNPMNGS